MRGNCAYNFGHDEFDVAMRLPGKDALVLDLRSEIWLKEVDIKYILCHGEIAQGEPEESLELRNEQRWELYKEMEKKQIQEARRESSVTVSGQDRTSRRINSVKCCGRNK